MYKFYLLNMCYLHLQGNTIYFIYVFYFTCNFLLFYSVLFSCIHVLLFMLIPNVGDISHHMACVFHCKIDNKQI